MDDQVCFLFSDLSRHDVPLAGGKGANLGDMVQAGMPVPPGFVVPAPTYREILARNCLDDEILRLMDDLDITTHEVPIQELGDDVFKDIDIVLGCLDNLETRLHLNSHCCYLSIPYIDGAMDSFTGKVQVVLPSTTPCLECLTNSSHSKILSLRFSCTGEDVSFHQPKVPAEITTTSIIGAIMVREAVKIACKRDDIVTKGVTYYSGERNTMDTYDLSIDPDCPNHQV